MKILVYGAGNIGCIYAAMLNRTGHDVAILARGKRLMEIGERGIVLREFQSGTTTTTKVKVVGRLNLRDAYDLVLVVLPKQHVEEVLPILAANRQTPNVMFFGNNASGSAAMIEALGRERVMLGFPGAAAINNDETIQFLILSGREQPTTIGEIDGSKSKRILEFCSIFRLAGFPMSISTNIDAWLKTHVAEISPTACALYMCGGDIQKLARTPEALKLMLRAVREGHGVLSKLGIPITPRSHRVFRWLPESLLLFLAKRKMNDPSMQIKIGHAMAARHEMKVIAGEFETLIRQSGLATPSIDILRRCLDSTDPDDNETANDSDNEAHARDVSRSVLS